VVTVKLFTREENERRRHRRVEDWSGEPSLKRARSRAAGQKGLPGTRLRWIACERKHFYVFRRATSGHG